tara:strand:+ start:62 stop:202 length:141 start_codon:yes stop_codon:yes gene_type:complete
MAFKMTGHTLPGPNKKAAKVVTRDTVQKTGDVTKRKYPRPKRPMSR